MPDLPMLPLFFSQLCFLLFGFALRPPPSSWWQNGCQQP